MPEQTRTHEESVAHLSKLIEGIHIAMMTTVGEDGALFSRPMVNQQLDEDGVLWFFSRDDSPKSAELLRNHDVNVAYSDIAKNRFVSVTGKATLLHDSEKAIELWKPTLRAWFPNGIDDPHLALIKVKILSAEYWEGPTNTVTRIIGLARTYLSGGKSVMGENEIVDFDRGAVGASGGVSGSAGAH